ncbi:hypothetical protein MBLNU457_3816t1 [Dothideomycetes sp. NU457]
MFSLYDDPATLLEKTLFTNLRPTSTSTHPQHRQWNIHQHLGGNGPWTPRKGTLEELNLGVPQGCRIDQVHMISRHAERYPTYRTGTRMHALVQRLKNSSVQLRGDLEFVNQWEFFLPDLPSRLENLVPVGRFAGTLEAFETGVKLRTRYEHLRQQALYHNQTQFWASGSERVEETARYFAAGFYGINWQDMASLRVVPETPDLGGDTLTPGVTCKEYRDSTNDEGHDKGYRKLDDFKSTYLPAIAERFHDQNPDIQFSETDIFTMQEMCGFELLATGQSPWCDVFSHEEWLSFEYARDVLHFYRAGAGNKYGPTMGTLYLNATKNLLKQGPEFGPLFFSFVHDGDIVPFVAALDLFPEPAGLPTSHIASDRNWRTSTIVPMGGRIILERLACRVGHSHGDSERDSEEQHYVRVIVNDAIVAVPGCNGETRRGCRLDAFADLVEKRRAQLGDFKDLCGLPEDAPGMITFLHQ